MKKKYQRPAINLYYITQQTALMAVSATETGVSIMSGSADKDGEVLSRGSGSIWDDDE